MAKKGIYYNLYNSYADDRPRQGTESGGEGDS